LNLFSIFN